VLALTRLVATRLWEVSVIDPATFASVAGPVVVVVLRYERGNV
jgi:hypothetical protein